MSHNPHRPTSCRIALSALLFASATIAQTSWSTASNVGAPAPNCSSAWDSGRNRVVAFGGQTGATEQNATREWDGTSWQVVNSASNPSPRNRPAMAYDEARGVTVMFSGGNSFNNDTWTFDGTTWTIEAPSSMPPTRFGSAMAYDKSRQVVVMFGGFVPSGQDANDIWEWNGVNWTQRTPAGPQPSARGAHRMVFDESLNAILMVGGFRTATNNTVSDAWSWNGTSWTQHASMPTTRCDQAMCYDVARQRTVVYGGSNFLSAAQTQLSDTWELYAGAWIQRTTATSPGDRANAAAAYLPDSKTFLIAGGHSFPGVPTLDTWAYEAITSGSADAFGQPCAITFGAQLEALTLPYLGLPFTQELSTSSPAAAIGLIVFGTSWQQYNGLPLPLDLSSIGAPACFLQTSVDVVNTVLLNGGTGTLTWNIPNTPSAAGFQFATQGVVIEPLSPLTLPIDMTGHLRCTVGNP